MAAGLGFKTFNTGDVLSASDVNGYLMQGVLVFADATARDAAITSPQEGQFAYTKNNDSLWYYTGSTWAASGATGDIEGVTAGTGISGGGTSGTVTITNSMATAIDAKGDLIVGTGSDTFSRLAVGSNDYVLTADSTQSTGLKWAAAASGGGFDKITSASFSSVSAVNVDSCFTSSYKNYKVIINITAASSAQQVPLRMRASGSNNSTSNYWYGFIGYRSDNTSGDGFTATADTGFGFKLLVDNANPNPATMTLDIINPQQAKQTLMLSSSFCKYSDYLSTSYGGGYFNGTTQFDGFSFYPNSGNITGEYFVYGYKD